MTGFTIKDLHQKLVKKEISAEKVTRDYLERIKKEDPKNKIYLTLNEQAALEEASKIDQKIKKGETIGCLEGIPSSVKDVLLTKNLRTTAASKALSNFIPPHDATAVKNLRDSGAIILGKTNCDEFAMGGSGENSAFGLSPNPLDEERVPGGSSSGSASAVAKDLCVFSLGSDTGGSVRLPASFCGIVGVKPTYGRISRFGLIAMASSLDQVGIMGKNVSDVTEVLSAISGPDEKDATSSGFLGKKFDRDFDQIDKPLTLAYDKKSIEKSDQPIQKASFDFLEKWKKNGGKIKEIEIPYLGEEAVACYYIITTSEVSSNMARYDGVRYGFSPEELFNKSQDWHNFISGLRADVLGKEVKRRIVMGTFCLSSGYYDAYYGKAQKVRAQIRKSLDKIFKENDLIFTPTSPDLPFKIGERTDDPVRMYLADAFTTMANLAGIPAISFPIGNTKVEGKNLSIGGQLMAKAWDEETLLRGALLGEKINSKN